MLRLHDTLRQSLAALVARRFGNPSRLDDHELVQLVRQLQKRRSFLDLRDLQTLAEFSRSPWSDAPSNDDEELELILRQIDRLDFTAKTDRGVVYSGAFCLSREPELRQGRFDFDTEVSGAEKRFTGSRSAGAYQYANSRSQMVIEMTSGGQWLAQNENRLRELGESLSDCAWAFASAKFVQSLVGKVEVFISYPLFEKTYPILETLLIFKNRRITQITFFLEHGSVRKGTLPIEFSGAGVPKTLKRLNKTLIFRLSSGAVD